MKKIANKKITIILFLGFFIFLGFASVYKISQKNSSKNQQVSYGDLHIDKIKNNKGVAGIDAELNGEVLGLGFPNTGKFAVPPRYNKYVCEYFRGKTYRWAIHSEKSVRKSRLGSLCFQFSNLGHVKIDFFTAGKGVLGYYVDGTYFVADTGDTEGGIALLELLSKAYKSTKTE